MLPGDLLAGQQNSVCFADFQGDDTGAIVNTGNQCGENFFFPAGKLLVDEPFFCFPDPLDDDLLGGLGGDAAEILGFDFDVDVYKRQVRWLIRSVRMAI